MWRGYVIHQLLYILHYAILCIYILYPTMIWYMTMYITSHTTLIYYNNYYYDNSNCYLFLLLLCCCSCCMCVCACMYCAVLSLLYVYVCSLVCPRIYSYMCIYVCLPRLTLLDCAVVKRLMCWYRGGIFREKNFLNFGNGVYHVHSQPKSYLVLESRFFHFFRLSKINANRNTNTITGVSTVSTATPITTNATNVNIAINQINMSFNN